ncbi:hypothetical protein Q5752_000793 [Cryptotrichosporon argae]
MASRSPRNPSPPQPSHPSQPSHPPPPQSSPSRTPVPAPQYATSSMDHAAPSDHVDVDKDELTTKGRKRKRLAKACSACHKNKRRCDGFAPCSNCEFSSRPCVYLNAQGEPIPPPRTRDSSTAIDKRKDDVHGERAANGTANGSGEPRDWAERLDGWNERKAISLFEAVERNPTLSAELIDIFLTRTPPYAAMFHPATFRHRLYLGQVSPFLLDAVYLLAARLCEHPAFLACFPPSTPPYLRGEFFAERCRAAVDRIWDLRGRWSDEDRRLDAGSWEETEFVQACALLAVYYNCTRQALLGLYYNDIALHVLRPGAKGALAQAHAASPIEYHTLTEIRLRTFWLLMLADMCSAANGRPRRLLDYEIAHIPLPGNEAHWARWGGAGLGGSEPGRRDTITPGTGNWHSEEGQIGELGHIIRILSIFANIMSIANNGGAGSHEAKHMPAQHYEQALKAWALDLPRHFRFDEVNLNNAVAKLHSPVPETAFSGWAFAYMHAVAESGMFYLQAAASQAGGGHWTVGRQGQAVDNLAVILDSLGERGRQGPLMFFPIMVVTSWTEHLRSTSSPVPVSLHDRLATWWAEARREWGWDRREVLERGVFPFPDREPEGVGASARDRDRRETMSAIAYRGNPPRERYSLPHPLSRDSLFVDAPPHSAPLALGRHERASDDGAPAAAAARYAAHALPPLHPGPSSRSRSPSPRRAGERDRDRERPLSPRDFGKDYHLVRDPRPLQPITPLKRGLSENAVFARIDRRIDGERADRDRAERDRADRADRAGRDDEPRLRLPARVTWAAVMGTDGIDALLSAAEQKSVEAA